MDRDERYQRFWGRLREQLRGGGQPTDLFDHDFAGDTLIIPMTPHVDQFSIHVEDTLSWISFDFEAKSRTARDARFAELQSKRTLIERSYGSILTYRRALDGHTGHIETAPLAIGIESPPSAWAELQLALIDDVARLRGALEAHIFRWTPA